MRSIANTHSIDSISKFAVSIKEKQDRFPTLYWLPKFHKRPYKARFIAYSSSCTTTVLSKLLTSTLTAVKNNWIRYYDTVYERDGINYFWPIKNSNDVLNKFKSKNFQASRELGEYPIPFRLGRSPNIWLATKNVLFSLLMFIIISIYGRVKKSVMALSIFWIIFLLYLELNFIDKLLVFRWELTVLLLLQICFFFCYERDFMKSLSHENQADIIEAFNSTSRYFDDLLKY